jgi:spore coat protein U-like protein
VPAEPEALMRDNALILRYEMYVDPARTRYWGDGVSYGTFTFQGPSTTGTESAPVHMVYGR